MILEWNEEAEQDREPKTMWVRDWHDASTYGTNLIDKIIPKRIFRFQSLCMPLKIHCVFMLVIRKMLL